MSCLIPGCPHDRIAPSSYCIFHETPADRERKREAVSSNHRLRRLPGLLREAERRVNAHVFKQPGDSTLCSIPANVDRDVDLLLIEAASAIELFCRPPAETSVAPNEFERRWMGCLRGYVPCTYGDAIKAGWIEHGNCEPHEWDNRTSAENARWMLEALIQFRDWAMPQITNPPSPAETTCSGCARLDKDLTQALEERDHAQDALQDTHVALGGDGEWKGRLPPQDPPESGDLHLDVPELARIKIAQMTDIIRTAIAFHKPRCECEACYWMGESPLARQQSSEKSSAESALTISKVPT